MSVKIIKSIKNAFSKYMNKNLLYYFCLQIIACYIITNIFHFTFNATSESNKIATTIIMYTIYLFLLTVFTGYYAVTSNNEINEKKELFPPIYKFFTLWFEGVKYMFATTIAILFYFIIPILIFITSIMIFKEFASLSLLLIAIANLLFVIITFTHLLPANLNYLKTLKLKDFLSLKKVSEYKKASRCNYLSYIGKLLLIGFLLYSIIIVVILSPTIIANVTPENLEASFTALESITKNIYKCIHIFFVIQILLIPNMNKQALYEDNQEEIQKNEFYDEDDSADEELFD